jgi:3-oxoacyl-[acyl-carrier-protein] synthase-3
LQVSNNTINKTGFIEMAGYEDFKIAVNRLSSLAQDTHKIENFRLNLKI